MSVRPTGAPSRRHGYPVTADRWPMGSALIHQRAGAGHAAFWFFGRKQQSAEEAVPIRP
ncbi:hypothetical protein ACTU45_36495 [Streptomyces sp. 24-1644]|uniref:hypothetical protein n=1 Tax=Streptomyces sp. 24-1644 TaxID=3457315 RepID=UPI003FA78E57